MTTVKIDLEEGLAALRHQTNQTVQDAAREMIVLELYRRAASPAVRPPSYSACRAWISFATRRDSGFRTSI
jgi:hypothetical protein